MKYSVFTVFGKFLIRLRGMKYGKIGKNSKVIKPLRIIGKEKIYIGEGVTIMNGARLETIQTWGAI